MAISNSDQTPDLKGWGTTLTVRVPQNKKKAGHSWG
jgi:hypothetical protein